MSTSGMIKIRIGASLDRSIDATFGEIAQRARKAGLVVERELNRGMTAGSGRGGPYRAAAREAERSYDQQTKAARRSYDAQARLAKMAEREQLRGFREIGKVAEQELNRQARAAQRAGRERERELDRFARRTSHRATRFLFPPPSGILGSARRMGTDLLRGAGIDFGFSGMVGRNVELQRSAIALSNQGYQPGAAGPNGQRVGAGTLVGEARGIADQYGLDPARIMAAHEAFVSLTGDLDSSRKGMADMARLSAATGASLEDVASAQANVSMQFKDAPDKAAKVAAVMRAIAGQGKLGAVEIKQLASQMAGLASQASMFGGDVGGNMTKLGALAQISRAYGGSKSATQAVTSVERFVGTFSTPARLKAFKAAGIDVYDKSGKVRDPFELIKESLVATGGDATKMGKLFSSVMAQRATRGLTNAYNTAGGGQTGLAAVQALFEKFTASAALSPKAINDNASRAMNSDAAKAQRFQNKLDEIAQKVQSSLLPALDKLAPDVLKAADAFGGIIKWAAENPGKAITAAIVASIARAGLEAAARGALENGIKKMFGGGGGGKGGAPMLGGGGGLLGAAGLGLVVGTITAGSILTTGKEDFNANSASLAELTKGLANLHGNDLAVALPQAKQRLQTLKDEYYSGMTGPLWGMAKDTLGIGNKAEFAGAEDLIRRKESEAAKYYNKPTSPEDHGRATANALRGTTLNVRVMNPEDMKQDGKPTVDPGGRSPAPGKK